ncbi:MAG: NYN domain-containing protein [Treponemataceae bacterium]|nr:NYN domain-containing protein [Treponemataceae bacterium]MDE5776082.1 NYN domain-containing protein [Treponemataceae bacterium]
MTRIDQIGAIIYNIFMDLKNIVVLIDADNVNQPAKIKAVLNEISAYGRIVVKRAYGNWKKNQLKNWDDVVKDSAIKAVQQFDYVAGKNASDMALTIEAMDLLFQKTYDGFVIVSSDSDFTPLATRLREAGVFVIGVGRESTSQSFKNSCDEFLTLESIEEEEETQEKSEEKKSPEKSKYRPGELHNFLKIASDKWGDDEGFVSLNKASEYIKRAKSDFNIKNYGYPKLTKFLEAFDKRYEIKKRGTEGAIYYKCKKR